MAQSIPLLLVLIPAFPLAATLVTAVFGKRILREQSHWPALAAIAASCVTSFLLVLAVQNDAPRHERIVSLWSWAAIDRAEPAADPAGLTAPGDTGPHDFRLDVVLRADPLTAIMLSMVTFISGLVVVYSIGYMHGDPGYWRFFTYVSLFVFSMTMLVSVSNFVLLYVFWEAVGMCSYLLIGFWFQKPEAAAAGVKAFLVNRVGDFGFALGIFLLWTTYGTLNFHDTKVVATVSADVAIADSRSGDSLADDGAKVPVAAHSIVRHDLATVEDPKVAGTVVWGILGKARHDDHSLYTGGAVATAICLLLLLGACGKSAQFPLHVWLPDAMEGPTPVSALIHAATMVTAGVYMVARCTPLFAASPDAQHVVAAIGGGTALMAAFIALTQTDLKRILAYSTVSQLGYMFLSLGTGTLLGVSAGMFHLFTHAFFKALLFLGAGSVMHAMGGVIDIRKFSGLRHKMPITHWTFLFGCLALAGIVPFAGFWSKDAILVAVRERAGEGDAGQLYWILYLAGVVTAFMTAFYTFRAFFLTFYGEERIPHEAGHHAHESPSAMTSPLLILAIGAICVGFYFQWTGDFLGKDGFLQKTASISYLQTAEVVPAVAEKGLSVHTTVAIFSTIVALAGVGLAYLFYIARPGSAKSTARIMTGVGLHGLSHGKLFFDEIYLALVVVPLEQLARLCAWIDRNLVDGLVDSIGSIPRAVGAVFRPLQSGMVQFYALVMVLGLLALIGALLL